VRILDEGEGADGGGISGGGSIWHGDRRQRCWNPPMIAEPIGGRRGCSMRLLYIAATYDFSISHGLTREST
jgi:hypothetical protein